MLILSVFCALRKNYFFSEILLQLIWSPPFPLGACLLPKLKWGLCKMQTNKSRSVFCSSITLIVFWCETRRNHAARGDGHPAQFCLQQWSKAGNFQEPEGQGKYVKILSLQFYLRAVWIEEGVIFLTQLWSLEDSLRNITAVGLCFSSCITCLIESV